MDKNLEQLKEQYRLLGEEISKLEAAPKRWRAKFDNSYYTSTDCNIIIETTDYNDVPDNYRYRTGNYFQTEEEALKWKEWHDTICELRAFSDGVDGEWMIYRDAGNYYAENYVEQGDSHGCINFATSERAEEAIKHFGSRLDVIYR